jgi:hypothetical protein
VIVNYIYNINDKNDIYCKSSSSSGFSFCFFFSNSIKCLLLFIMDWISESVEVFKIFILYDRSPKFACLTVLYLSGKSFFNFSLDRILLESSVCILINFSSLIIKLDSI